MSGLITGPIVAGAMGGQAAFRRWHQGSRRVSVGAGSVSLRTRVAVVLVAVAVSALAGASIVGAAPQEKDGRRFREWFEARNRQIEAQVPALKSRRMTKAGFPGLVLETPTLATPVGALDV